MTVIRTSCWSATGPRERNEDYGIALQATIGSHTVALLGVCDGMGGDENGPRAAYEMIAALSGVLAYLPASIFDRTDRVERNEAIHAGIRTWYAAGFQRLEQIAEAEVLRGLTTTLVACLAWDDHLVVWWMGDSRASRFREGTLEHLTHDHSKVYELLGLPEEEALEHPERSKITRFIRPGVSWEPEIVVTDWRDGDVLLLMSDGVSGSCHSWELEACLAYWLTADVSPQQLAQHIFGFLGDNVQDNATMAIAMRGAARPLADDVALISVPSFVAQGLRKEIIEALGTLPTTGEEWLGRERPPWRDAVIAGNAEPRIVARHAPLMPPEAAMICLKCGTQMPAGFDCPTHGADHLWRGTFVQVVSPDGETSFYPVEKNEITIGYPTTQVDIALADEYVSVNHLRVHFTEDFRCVRVTDCDSDNGTWLRIRNTTQDIVPDSYDISLLVGAHRVIVRTTPELVANPASETLDRAELGVPPHGTWSTMKRAASRLLR
jgi:serine/threonine protein phosphatase PrpC